jgi:hypothetical protein
VHDFVSGKAEAIITVKDFRLFYGDFMALKGLSASFPMRKITALYRPLGVPQSPRSTQHQQDPHPPTPHSPPDPRPRSNPRLTPLNPSALTCPR